MFQLLSAESYKLKKSKSLYICIAVMIAMIFLAYCLVVTADRIADGELENGTGGVVVTENGEPVEPGNDSILEELGVAGMVERLFSGDMMACVTAVFISIFVVGDYAGGMMKNIVGKGRSRGEIFWARLIVAEASVILIYLVSIASALLFGWVFVGKEGFAAAGFWPDLAAYTGLQLALGIGLTAVLALVGEVTRSYAAGISLGIGVAALPVFLVTGLDLLCRNSGITPSDYWLVTRSAGCQIQEIGAGYAVETLVVSAVWFFLAAGLGMWHFYRADIR